MIQSHARTDQKGNQGGLFEDAKRSTNRPHEHSVAGDDAITFSFLESSAKARASSRSAELIPRFPSPCQHLQLRRVPLASLLLDRRDVYDYCPGIESTSHSQAFIHTHNGLHYQDRWGTWCVREV
jgi:hypothetical protein